MRRFECVCGQALWFENTACLECGRRVAFLPAALAMVALEPGAAADSFRVATAAGAPPPGDRAPRRLCDHHRQPLPCNWLVDEDDHTQPPLCRSCRATAVVPPLDRAGNRERWGRLERAKRRLIYDLLRLELPVAGSPALEFAFLEDRRTNPAVEEEWVSTGYHAGRITVHAGEADDLFRETQRTMLRQPWRSLLGHFRHEAGHYLFDRLVRPLPERLLAFRALFGDERRDYAAALRAFYQRPPAASWPGRYLTPYGETHPLEDWAECCEHLLHADDAMETARHLGLAPPHDRREDFDGFLAGWRALAVALNELARSLGRGDTYPFVIGPEAARKLAFVGTVFDSARSPTGPAAAR